MEQRRLLIAFILSAVILFGWSYFFPPPRPTQNNANSSEQAQDSKSVPESTSTQATPQPAAGTANNAPAPDEVPHRTLTVSTPLYEIALDTRGAVATSWIIKRNKEGEGEGKPLYSIASTKERPQPLQLVSPQGVERGIAPLLLTTATERKELNDALSTRNYQVAGLSDDGPAPRLELNSGEQKTVEFRMVDPSSGLDVTKRLTFDADRYAVRVETRATQNSQPLSSLKLAIGPSIGDQGVPRYTFYSVAPEGVAFAGNQLVRLRAAEVDGSKESPHRREVGGPVQWAGIGDTYFAMALALPQPIQGLEYRTEKYEHEANGQKEDRFLITGYVPVPADGSPMYLYTGPKDHDQLQQTSAEISRSLPGQQVDLEGLIDYGRWFGFITRYLATPILWSIKHLNRLTGSYGLAIILFTIIIYMLFFPLKWRSSKSMKKAQKLAPRMKELQEKIKGMKQNDPRLKELQMEQLRLMKEGNPLGGCLPLLIQMPFLIALYSAITISIDFRQSSFLWIPDLSASDFTHVLPILMAGSMLVLQLITPAPSADPLQRKMMAVVMPAMMLYILWSAPAGLLVYWLVGNLVGFGQQVVINRLVKSEDDTEQQPPGKTEAGTRTKKRLNEARASQA